MENKFKVGDTVMLPRFSNFNSKFDRDVGGKIKEIRQGRFTSYLIGKTWSLEPMLRPTNGNTLTLLATDKDG